MNVSRKKFDRFSFAAADFPKEGQPYFQTVRMRQKLGGERNQINVSDESLSRLPSLQQGIFQFPLVRRSDKSNNTCSSGTNFSLKIFKTPSTPNISSKGSILSFLKSSSDTSQKNTGLTNQLTSESKSTFWSDHVSLPSLKNSFHTPVLSSKNHFQAKSSSGINTRSFNSTSTSDSQFFTTPKKRSSGRTPKSSSSNFSDAVNSVVIAITEGRGHARGEVGIAAIDVKRPFLTLCEISDTQTYVNTLSKINILNPAEILVPNSFYDSLNPNKLYQMISDNFPYSNLRTVQRKFFNENSGLQLIQSICLPEFSSTLLVIPRKFYALAAAAAVLKFAEFEQNMIFSPRSIRVNFESGNNITFIDLETAQKLELVNSQITGNTYPENTLYGVMNNCCTLSGQRRLRSIILQPSSDEEEINKRLDCVEELVNNVELFFSIKSILPKFEDVEQLLSLSMQLVNLRDGSKCVEMQINFILLLKTSLEALPSLQKSLANTKANFFTSFRKNLDNIQYKKMLSRIYKIINSDAHLSPKFDICQFQRCFCIKTGIDAFLDVARLAYTELVEDFNGIVDDLIKEHQLPLIIRTLKSKGPVLQMKLNGSNDNFNIKDLPSVFVQVEKSRSCITMTTKELLFLKERMNHFVQEIQTLSSMCVLKYDNEKIIFKLRLIFDLMKDIREYVGSLFILCENIAELDLVTSFAHTSKNFSFVRPSFSSNCMKLKSSEHPILHRVSLTKPVPNDVFATTNSNMSIITGPNMGGKSVYIRQIALLQIMAQSGCYVPAEYAQFRITDRIFSRTGFSDDIECNASSFIVELKEMNYIMKSLTPRSLIIIDELCRGTSNEEGASIAWAILEELQASTAFIFVTTHFPFLTKLEELYCNVNNWHFDTLEIDVDENGSLPSLVYTHRLVPGVMKLEHYGLKLAKVTAIPENILQSAEEMMKSLSAEWKASSFFDGNIQDSKIIDTVVLKMLEMIDNQTLTILSAKYMVDHALEMRLNIDGENESNSEDQIAIEQNCGSPSQLTELENSVEDDVSENMQVDVNVVEGNDEVLAEVESILRNSTGSENSDDGFQLDVDCESNQMNEDHSINGDEVNEDQPFDSSIFADCSYIQDEICMNGRFHFPKVGDTINDVESKSDHMENNNDRELSDYSHLHGTFINLKNEKYQNNTYSATQDDTVLRKECSSLRKGGLFHFYSV